MLETERLLLHHLAAAQLFQVGALLGRMEERAELGGAGGGREQGEDEGEALRPQGCHASPSG